MSQGNVDTPAMAAGTESQPQLNKAALTMLRAASITALGPLWYLAQNTRLDGALAVTLLLLPSILIACGGPRLLTIHHRHPVRLILATTSFDVAKNLLVAAYVGLKASPTTTLPNSLAWLSLIAASVLIGLVYRLTSWIMNAHADHGQTPAPLNPVHEGVIRQLLQHRFLSICGLLVANLNLLLFLGLAVAFHDRATGGVSFERQVQRHDLPNTSTGAGAERQPRAGRIRTFAFPLGSTSLGCTASASGRLLPPEFFEEGTTNDWRVRRLRSADFLSEKVCVDELDETAWNVNELHGLKAELSGIYNDAPFDRYRVAVVAHATDNKPSFGFASNYEMSRARAEQVQALVETMLAKLRVENPRLPPLNLEWQIMPSGTGNMYLSSLTSTDAGRLTAAGLSRHLTTEVQFTRIPNHLTKLQRESLERHNGTGEAPELQLLDYLYFIITNASASDLAPASGFVQFVAAAGHISQLFLLVVAFNVILAFRRPLIEGDQKAAA
jgi:hypothetical protein